MMITVVAIYASCWLPTHLITILGDATNGRIYDAPEMSIVWIFFNWLAMSSSCYNPIIYIWMNSKFRQGFKKALRCLPCIVYDDTSAVIFNYHSQNPGGTAERYNTYRSAANGTSRDQSRDRPRDGNCSSRDYPKRELRDKHPSNKKRDVIIAARYRNTNQSSSPRKLILYSSIEDINNES